jgi:hypothetical protein
MSNAGGLFSGVPDCICVCYRLLSRKLHGKSKRCFKFFNKPFDNRFHDALATHPAHRGHHAGESVVR